MASESPHCDCLNRILSPQHDYYRDTHLNVIAKLHCRMWMQKLILTHPDTLFSPCLAACDFSSSPVLSVKMGTRIDYTCKEMRGKMKEGENEKASVGANGPLRLSNAV